jgi:hypothetical protein
VTRIFRPEAEQVAAELIVGSGNGLFSVVRETGFTCETCATPIPTGRGLRWCVPCLDHIRSGLPLADRVGSLIYALEDDSQVYKIVRNYKAEAYRETDLPRLMTAMLALGMREHWQCAMKLAPAASHGWAVVPSTRGRTKLRELVLEIGAPPLQEVALRYTGAVGGGRALHPENWALEQGVVIPEHVVVVDDSWVTGSNAQGVASMLKQSGALRVSSLAVARVMRPGFGANPEFIRSRLAGSTFDGHRCPWTGGECPD